MNGRLLGKRILAKGAKFCFLQVSNELRTLLQMFSARPPNQSKDRRETMLVGLSFECGTIAETGRDLKNRQ